MARSLRVLHAIHDFLPRHRAGSEIYAFELCQALQTRCHVTVLAAEHDLGRPHGQLTWRVQEGLPVVEVVNNWTGDSFADTYEGPLMSRRLEQVLDAVQPDVLHVHSLLNLSFGLPAVAQARGIPVVATLHDYSLVCPSGGQRVHRAESHVCHTIDVSRCARCFAESPFQTLATVGRAARLSSGQGIGWRVAKAAVAAAARVTRAVPGPSRIVRQWAKAAGAAVPTPEAIEQRLTRARAAWDGFDLVVAPSVSLAREFVALGMPDRHLVVSDYGFRELAPPSSPRPPVPRGGGRTGGTVRFGYLGTLVWHKGPHLLVEAARLVQRRGWSLEIHGDPTIFPDYAAKLRPRSDAEPIRLCGPYDHRRVADILAGFDALVVPSIWLENSPLVIHEAFMAGVPVIGARMGGIADLVQHDVNGWLYDAWSPRELAALLERAIDRPDELARLAAATSPVKSIADDAAEWLERYQSAVDARADKRRPAASAGTAQPSQPNPENPSNQSNQPNPPNPPNQADQPNPPNQSDQSDQSNPANPEAHA